MLPWRARAKPLGVGRLRAAAHLGVVCGVPPKKKVLPAQYFLILSRALWGDVDVRNAVSLDADGVDGAVAILAKWGRRQWSLRRMNEVGFVSMVNRSLRLVCTVCGIRVLLAFWHHRGKTP
jgi:hypothetical protein